MIFDNKNRDFLFINRCVLNMNVLPNQLVKSIHLRYHANDSQSRATTHSRLAKLGYDSQN